MADSVFGVDVGKRFAAPRPSQCNEAIGHVRVGVISGPFPVLGLRHGASVVRMIENARLAA